MPTYPDVTIDLDVVLAIQDTAKRAPRTMQTFVERTVLGDIQKIGLQRLSIMPGPAVHPFAFATPKSRRWYFWAVSQGIIPTDGNGYLRSGETARSWFFTINPLAKGASIGVGNAKEHATFVYGPRQVPGHRVTGWVEADTVIGELSEMATEMVIDGWFSITEELERGGKFA